MSDDLFAVFGDGRKPDEKSKKKDARASAKDVVNTANALNPDYSPDNFAPLASRLRPDNIDDFIGQSHLVGKGMPLYESLKRGQCHSMIFWGPPGTGKTTLALIIAKSTNAYLEIISAVSAGVKEIREAISNAVERRERGQRTVLFVDEVHRFNKSQQDAFLPYIENGTITFIGATTENPSFELNNALLSRARVHVLHKLTEEEQMRLIDVALTSEKGLASMHMQLDENVRKQLINIADGDGRHLLTSLEMLSEAVLPDESGVRTVTPDMVATVAGRHMPAYDKGGDFYYDLISAFHKSVRGSAPQAALYWYGRILTAGGDPLYVARRLLAIATEDVGLADPGAMTVALNAYDIFKRVGPAEGERAIAEAAVYLSLAPKSNALYLAFNQAKKDARDLPSYDVPLYLRNHVFCPTKLWKEDARNPEAKPLSRQERESLNSPEGYRYAHDYPFAYAAGECFMPKELEGKVYYTPNDRGLEIKLGEKMEFLRKLDEKETNPRFKK